MQRAVLLREPSTDQGTPGLIRAGDLQFSTMEPPWRQNERNRSSIPAGEYPALPHRSPRFGRCLLVAGVEGRSHILVHAGNLGGDVRLGYATHTRGCLLPGLSHGRLRVLGTPQRAVLGSRTALRRLLDWAGDAPFRLEVVSP